MNFFFGMKNGAGAPQLMPAFILDMRLLKWHIDASGRSRINRMQNQGEKSNEAVQSIRLYEHRTGK
jgi:hypothetical protein